VPLGPVGRTAAGRRGTRALASNGGGTPAATVAATDVVGSGGGAGDGRRAAIGLWKTEAAAV